MKTLKFFLTALLLLVATMPAEAEVPFLKTDNLYSIKSVIINGQDPVDYSGAISYITVNGDAHIIVVPSDGDPDKDGLDIAVPLSAWEAREYNGSTYYSAKIDDVELTIMNNGNVSTIFMETSDNAVAFFYDAEPFTTL